MASLFWLVAAAILTFISRYLYAEQPPYSGGEFYIGFYLIYGATVLVTQKLAKLPSFKLDFKFYLLGCVVLLLGKPLFENDYYRYLWEGKVLLSGHNPYVHSPISAVLDHINFPIREKVAFGHLSTIYSPLSLLLFSVASILSFPGGLYFLMLLNCVLVYLFLKEIAKYNSSWQMYLILPFLQKEFIHAVHIDMLAALFLTYYLIEKSFKKRLLYLCLSFWVKYLSITLFPVELMKQKLSIRSVAFLIGVTLSLFGGLFFLSEGNLRGFNSFSKYWTWSPGLYTYLQFVSSPKNARLMTYIAMAVFQLGVLIWGIRKYRQQGVNKELIWSYSLMSFAGLNFFSPVYNGWYAIWFMVPALLLKNKYGVLYGVMSVFCYSSYVSDNYAYAGAILAHLFFPLVIGSTLMSLKKS